MGQLQFFVVLCYSIPFLVILFPIGLSFSYIFKITGLDRWSNRINNYLGYFWYRSFFLLTGRTLDFQQGNWDPEGNNRFLICNHTNAMEVPLIVALPYLSNSKNVKLSYLGGDIIQRYKIIPLMMHKTIVEAVIYSEKKPNFRNFKTDVLRVLKTRSIFLYPEGERTFTEEIKPFQTGVMKIAYKFNVDLDVFVVSGMMGYSNLPEYSYLKKTKTIYFHFCGSIKAKDFSTFESYLSEAETLMKNKKKEIEALEKSAVIV
ncbi:1-acyl-sn-glycerol-3-phosphate acyltransferase [Leptospira meyeri]|uniref:1-acyl-sn-glycerol-3-phosphate acyltransferase n=1 Tax=Leptospira meyeri TaxID=29508 RepID=A0A4R8ML21_LEPME|nr:1-acyl-sn-glycerol-3-phosphate acyltransferase [Leptospira meyeri]EKJ87918.1 acyltransferase [Leptospira meyeri serovar Hardjo str. Went 5]TDY67906.1 1-acyl-sn-glycerol-3-phosphate acyltransferase [Leptospira meyeri]TGL52187.1 acyl-phosphate glycerol 3-phosphate acyltransferase [Leptospira meyeri]